jgi:transcriptional regulator with XRE-family HTH domain
MAEEAVNTTIRGNVFEALDLPDAPELLARVDLAVALTREIRRLGLTRTQAAERVGLDPADVSRIMRGNVENVNQERLERALNGLAIDVEIRITRADEGRPGTIFVDMSELLETS